MTLQYKMCLFTTVNLFEDYDMEVDCVKLFSLNIYVNDHTHFIFSYIWMTLFFFFVSKADH